MVKLLVADAHFIVRMGMKQLRLSMGGFSVEGEARSSEEVLAALDVAHFDMLVIDLSLHEQLQASGSDVGSITLIDTIRAQHKHLPILVFTSNNDPLTAKRVLGRGVFGFISKSCDQEVLVTAMRKVSLGETYISPDIAIKMMVEYSKDRTDSLRGRLSARESQVLNLLGQGKSLSAISDELFISSRTVSTHKIRLMQKMNFKSNAELFHYALECCKTGSIQQAVRGSFSHFGESVECNE